MMLDNWNYFLHLFLSYLVCNFIIQSRVSGVIILFRRLFILYYLPPIVICLHILFWLTILIWTHNHSPITLTPIPFLKYTYLLKHRRAFSTTLAGMAQSWFGRLEEKSIYDFDQLCDKFMGQFGSKKAIWILLRRKKRICVSDRNHGRSWLILCWKVPK
ncbi:hypothetical protein ACJIZ3_023450 [Penstemon smallii]|uniref:Retrotransposon gag domain-containing protein n=1 Tax=Penstemon smallii TaxID=265156 RepID=A0ABD3TP60_9LAMI